MAYEDLLKDTSASFEDGNYFVVTVPDLTPGTIYPIEFRWKYKDGTFSEWGCVKTIVAPLASTPSRPGFSQGDLSYFQGILTVTWSGQDFNNLSYGATFDRVDVYVASDANPAVFTVRGSIKVPGGKLDIPVEPGTYYVKLKTIFKPDNQSIFSTNTFSITCKADAPAAPTAISASWSGTDFNVSFSHDSSATSNKYFSYYRISLTAGSTTRTFNLTPVSGLSQLFALSLAKNRAAFGVPQTSFSGSVSSVDTYGNSSPTVSFGSTTYVNSLAAPIIAATEIQQGYSISYTTPTSATYDHIEIEEVESNAGTAPSTGYSVIFSGVANPAPIIRPNQNKRWVRARFADNIGSFSAYSTAIAATPLSPATVDNVPPAAPSSGTVTAGVDNSAGATVGFNAYLDISWTAVSDSTLRGHRIRFRENGTSGPYSYVDSPGNGTTFRLNGLSIGTTYEVAVASYDEYNNTSSAYTSIGTATATGTPFIGKNVTTVGYFGASATGDTGTFKFGYGVQDSGGTKRGLVFNPNNYWYIDSAQSALFKLGGNTDNYISWDGATFIVQGDLRAKKGNFSGNVEIQLGGSLYSGALTQAGALSGAGFILNKNGLTFNSTGVDGITTINGTTGLFTTKSANIGGWDVDSSSIKRTSNNGTITLNSTSAQIIASSTSYQAGVATPDTNSGSDIVFWAGGARSTSANFYVTADGTVKITSAIITSSTPFATSGQLATTNNNLTATNATVATKVGASEVKNHIGGQGVTTITGNKISTGSIQSGTLTGTTNGTTYTNEGVIINLDGRGYIASPNFYINSSGSAFFRGSVIAQGFALSDTSGDYWSITPGSTSTGFRFGGADGIQFSGGKITLGTNTEIYGDLALNSYNYWKPSNNTFNVGSSSKYINFNGSVLTVAGKIIADSGNIGGWVINSNGSISNGTTYFFGSSTDAQQNANGWAIFDYSKSAYFSSYSAGSDGYVTASGSFTTVSGNMIVGTGSFVAGTKTFIYGNGTIYANTLGTGSGLAIHQVQAGANAGYLKVNTSTIRHKENIDYIGQEGYLNKIANMSPAFFNYKEGYGDPSRLEIGLIAEDLEELGGFETVLHYNNDNELMGISYDKLSAMLILSIKELKSRLDALEG